MSNILCGLKHYLNYLHYFFFLTPKPFGIEASTMHRLTQLFLIVFHLYVDSESNICWPSNTIMSSSLQKFRIRNGWSMGGILLFLSASTWFSIPFAWRKLQHWNIWILEKIWYYMYCMKRNYISLAGLISYISFLSVYKLLQANQSTYQRTLTVLSRVHTSICETGLVSRGMLDRQVFNESTLV
jgi:hypothetical protein